VFHSLSDTVIFLDLIDRTLILHVGPGRLCLLISIRRKRELFSIGYLSISLSASAIFSYTFSLRFF
jgi:hypothetical protein